MKYVGKLKSARDILSNIDDNGKFKGDYIKYVFENEFKEIKINTLLICEDYFVTDCRKFFSIDDFEWIRGV